jgi:glycosyltransferase involved in cell wall biosynthesis
MISIIIPTLNEERSLPSLLDAVCRQGEEYEVIVVDGGSQDRTLEIARRYGVRTLSAPPGRGKGICVGAAASCGENTFDAATASGNRARSMSPKWITTPIRAGASRRREYVPQWRQARKHFANAVSGKRRNLPTAGHVQRGARSASPRCHPVSAGLLDPFFSLSAEERAIVPLSPAFSRRS